VERKKLVRKAEPSKPPPEPRVQLEKHPKSRWQSIKNRVVRATKVPAVLLITVLIISIIWLLWREVIRVGGNSDYILRVVLTVVGIWILIHIGSLYEWTGFGERALEKAEGREIQPRKTLWDWMSLLLVPLMIAGIASWFTWWQSNSQQAQDERQRAQIAESQAEYSALQAYIDQMSQLITEKNLRDAEEDEVVFRLAQARTTTSLALLDGEQDQILIRFLSGTGLLRETPLLAKVDLQDTDLSEAELPEANLAGTNLRGTNLTDAVLVEADFYAEEKVGKSTQVIPADLTKADLRRANLQGANLTICYLNEATLTDAALQSAVLRGADLRGADLSHAALQGAKLSPATLPGRVPKIPTKFTDADLHDAALQRADLSSAVLQNANLNGADLTNTNLSDATGWTLEQLTAARSLEGATMPNGQKYEDWRKESEKHQQDE
jgi:uncharacterized protein YjbI with pentapeptide repeats